MVRLWTTHFRWLSLSEALSGLWVTDDYGNAVKVNAQRAGYSLGKNS